MIRVQKYLSEVGYTSRRAADDLVKSGRVSVNGTPVTPGTKVDPDRDQVSVDGKLVSRKAAPKVYWALHKPSHVLTTRSDPQGRTTIYDLDALKKVKFNLPAAGRLDFETEGLLILSNDGQFVEQLIHPRSKVPRYYHALVKEKLKDDQIKKLNEGIPLEDGIVKVSYIKYLRRMKLGASFGYWYEIAIKEGRNRVVRRIFETFGSDVVRLIRFRIGDFWLPPELQPGKYLQLTRQDRNRLLRNSDKPV